ncbi:MAG: CPBP family intramembrane metalloprotease [Candidatus Eisenbacteria bacterium]|uniref:CPBP family intramembrane metalloprotease n=1 Tax=Eiseniibacteriota bacterium TaxID=2212470 RepID=A0A849SIT5_UNCEI|nr:CPBP family intramembrane metalloprotease [Candidatus Eisenbacteria bacterium]
MAPLELTNTPAGRGLMMWLGLALGAGVIGVVIGSAELGMLTVLGALFALAHAVDRDSRWLGLHLFLAWILPAIAVFGFLGLAAILAGALPGLERHPAGAIVSVVAAALTALTFWPAFTDALAQRLFRRRPSTHGLRLATRLMVVGLAACYPTSVAFRIAFEQDQLDAVRIGTASFVGTLLGMVLLSLGAVGAFVTRDLRGSIARLGLRQLRAWDPVVVVLGVAALLALNTGVEWAQQAWFPAAGLHDRRVTEFIANPLSRLEMVMLGLSAGIGEELALRGALQPRLGILVTALLFGSLHVQYSWVGMIAIVLFGLLFGVVRRATSTTVVILMHVIYDLIAVMGARSS